MKRVMLGGKIHRATVTGADIDYEGSIEIDTALLDAAGIYPYEKVHVYDINNGNRFETYTIEGKRGSGVICVNGAAARLVNPGDKIIIVNFIVLDQKEARNVRPRIVLISDEKNTVSPSSPPETL
ncbi:MAG: aspartate 1-decarboxylase [Nitrospinota bacterium]